MHNAADPAYPSVDRCNYDGSVALKRCAIIVCCCCLLRTVALPECAPDCRLLLPAPSKLTALTYGCCCCRWNMGRAWTGLTSFLSLGTTSSTGNTTAPLATPGPDITASGDAQVGTSPRDET